MSCETWAPESEKVTTVRGCLMSSSAWSWFSLAMGWRKREVEVPSRGPRRSWPPRDPPALAWRSPPPSGAAPPPVHDEDPFVDGPAVASCRSALLVALARGPRSGGGAARDRAGAASARRAGSARSSFHTAAVEREAAVLNESMAESQRLWHLGEHAAAPRRRRRRAARVRPPRCRARPCGVNRPKVIGRPVSTARSRSRRGSRARPGWPARGPRSLPAISKMPAFISPMTPTRRRTSSHAAMRLATGRRSGVSWLVEREVVKPMAPRVSASGSSLLHAP
jgi:hypothetical protein